MNVIRTSFSSWSIVFLIILVKKSESPDIPCPSICAWCSSTIAVCDVLRLKSIPSGFSDTIIQLNLAGNLLESITKADLPNLPNLEVLDLSDNWIKTIENGAFSKYPKLIDLNLAKNQIKRITNETFTGLPNLDKLNLNDQYLNSESLCIGDFAFSNITKLEWLWLKGNNLKQITEYTFENLNIGYLNIENQDILRFEDGAFVGVKPNAHIDFHRMTNRLCCCKTQNSVHDTPWSLDCIQNGTIYKIRNVACVNDSYCIDKNPTTCSLNVTMNANQSTTNLGSPTPKTSESGKRLIMESECNNSVYVIIFGSLGMITVAATFVVGYLVWRQRYRQANNERMAVSDNSMGTDTNWG